MRERRVLAALLLAHAWACSSMQPVPVEFIPETNPMVVEVTGQYGLRVALQNPRISGDTIYGTASGAKELAVPLQNVGSISAKRFSSGRTALLVAGGVALAGMATFFIAISGNSEPELDCGIDNPIDPNDREKCGV